MTDWYINKMMEAHNEQRWDDRRNYAKAASVDFIKMIYFKEVGFNKKHSTTINGKNGTITDQ